MNSTDAAIEPRGPAGGAAAAPSPPGTGDAAHGSGLAHDAVALAAVVWGRAGDAPPPIQPPLAASLAMMPAADDVGSGDTASSGHTSSSAAADGRPAGRVCCIAASDAALCDSAARWS